ncbi:MAG: thiosulfate oxidation carrier complex protein SoxZ [Pseudomonadota bacterium]
MAKGMRVRARLKDGVTEVKALITHPMETGQRRDPKTGMLIPAHYISEVSCEYKGENVMTALWGPGVSKNPFISFKFNGGAAGEKVTLGWKDNQDGGDTVTIDIK